MSQSLGQVCVYCIRSIRNLNKGHGSEEPQKKPLVPFDSMENLRIRILEMKIQVPPSKPIIAIQLFSLFFFL